MKHDLALLSLRSREGLMLLFALVVLLFTAFLSYRVWMASSRDAHEVDQAQRLGFGIDALLSSIKDAETGQRGYLLTGEDRYLQPYRRALLVIPGALKSVAAAAIERPDQVQRIERLGPLVNQKLAELAMTVELRRGRGLSVAVAVVRTDLGLISMDRIRGICSEIKTVAIGRLIQYSQQARANTAQGALTSLLACASLFLLLLAANVVIQRGVAGRQLLIGELQQSDRRLRETAADANAANLAKSTFLSTMSHEIRTPLNAVLGYTQLMLRDPALGGDAKANLAIIGRSGEHLLGLINDVLDMSKIEAGRTKLNPVTFNLSLLLQDLAAMFRLRARAKSLGFEMLVDGESTLYVVADERRMRQVLINLLGNAIKFTKHGRVGLQVTLEPRKADRLWLLARVEDTGPGLTEKEQSRVFDPFIQTSRGVHSEEGTGLGLAISRTYARLMGGDITVTGSPGQGCTFRFEIPVERGVAAVALRQAPVRRVMGLRAGTKAPRILVVDDQLENRDWLMKLLKSIGFSLRVADNGEAAIRGWAEWNPQLILMDVHMPGMDGLEATRRIKADARGKDTAILVLTASALEEDRQTVFTSGADGFHAKPCRVDELLEQMRALLHIDYDYQEMSQTESQSRSLENLSAEMHRLSPQIVEELRNAISDGNKRRLDKAILEVGETVEGGPAQALQALADNYDYEALTRLLEEAGRS